MQLTVLFALFYALEITMAFLYQEDLSVVHLEQPNRNTASLKASELKSTQFRQTSVKSRLMRRQSPLDMCDTTADCRQPGSICDKSTQFYDRPTNHFLGECMPPRLSDGSRSCNMKNFPKCPNGTKCWQLPDDHPERVADGDGKCRTYGRAGQPGCIIKNGRVTACA